MVEMGEDKKDTPQRDNLTVAFAQGNISARPLFSFHLALLQAFFFPRPVRSTTKSAVMICKVQGDGEEGPNLWYLVPLRFWLGPSG